MRIKIYGRPNCQWCDAAINLLNRKHIAFEYYNLFDLPFNEKQDVVAQSGMKTVPIVKVGDTFIGGFDQLDAYIHGKEKNDG